jgi:hypothetical protein
LVFQLIRSKTMYFRDLVQEDLPSGKRVKGSSDDLMSSIEDAKISQVFVERKPLANEGTAVITNSFLISTDDKPIITSTSSKDFYEEISSEDLKSSQVFEESVMKKPHKVVSWGDNPKPVIIPSREDLDRFSLWWEDLHLRGIEKMLQRNDEEELREFCKDMQSLGDLLSVENREKYTYEALTSPLIVDQSQNASAQEEVDLGDEF